MPHSWLGGMLGYKIPKLGSQRLFPRHCCSSVLTAVPNHPQIKKSHQLSAQESPTGKQKPEEVTSGRAGAAARGPRVLRAEEGNTHPRSRKAEVATETRALSGSQSHPRPQGPARC